MASPTDYGPRMLRCPACNAGLPVDGKSPIVTCTYCNARVEIDRRGQPQVPAPTHGAFVAPARSAFAWQWVMVPLVFAISMGMGAYQWWRAQSLISTPPPVTTPTAVPTHTPVPSRPPVTTIHDVAVTPTVAASPAITPDPPAPPPTTPTAPPKPRAVHPPTPAPTGPVLTVEDSRKLIEPKARGCMAAAKVHHLRAYMGNTKRGPVKVLPDSRTQVDEKNVALAKTPLGRCLNEAGAKVNTEAFRSNYVRLDIRI